MSGLSFGIGFCLSMPVNKNIENSLLTGLGASVSTVASVSILGKFNKIDAHIYRSKLHLAEQKKDVEAQIEHLQNEQASAGESLAIIVEQLDKKNQVYSQLSDRTIKLESDKEDLESRLSQYYSELEDISLLIEDRNDEVDQLNQSKSAIESTLEDLHNQQTAYESRAEEQKHHLNQLGTEVSSLEAQRSSLLATRKALNEEIKSVEQNRADLNSFISDLEFQRDQLLSEEDSLSECIVALGSQAESKEAEIEGLTLEINELNQSKQLIKDRKIVYLVSDSVCPNDTVLNDRKKAIQETCEARNIDICTHFTRIENLPSILINGLIPRKHLDKTDMDFISVNSRRLEDYVDANCLNISFPHHIPVLSANERTKRKWVYISYKKDILWELDCAFCFTKAASEEVLSIPISERKTEKSFKKMFIGNDHLPKDYPTDSQAEVLVFDIIPSFYLEKITFYDDEVRDNWIKDNPIFSFNDRLFRRRDQIRICCESPIEVNKHN